MITRRTGQVSMLHPGGEEREISAWAWMSENITFELQDRHPTSGGYVDRTNDHNITRLDAILTNPQLLIWAPGVRLAIL